MTASAPTPAAGPLDVLPPWVPPEVPPGVPSGVPPGVPPQVPSGVHVRHAVPPARPAAADLAVLAPEERRRAERIRVPAAAARHVTGRALLRRLVATLLGVPARDVVLQVRADGRPTLPGPQHLRLGVAHTDGMVVVAAAPTAVGVDVERADRWPLPPAAAWLSDRERDRLAVGAHAGAVVRRRWLVRAWTAKEATAKGLGRGLSLSPTAIEVAGSIAHVRAEVDDGLATWHLHDLPIAATHVVTLAVPEQPQPGVAQLRGTCPISSPARSLSPR